MTEKQRAGTNNSCQSARGVRHIKGLVTLAALMIVTHCNVQRLFGLPKLNVFSTVLAWTIESRRRGPLLEFRRTKTDLERNSLYFRGLIIWNSINITSRWIEKVQEFKAALKSNKNQLRKVTFIRGTVTNLNKHLNYFMC